MNLKEELDKAKYDLTSYQVDQLLALFEKKMNEIIGEVEFEHYYRSDVRKEQRERLKKLVEVGDAK